MKIAFPLITAVLLVPTSLGNQNLQIVSGEDQAVDDQHSAVAIVNVSSIFDDGHYQSRGLSSKKRKKEKSKSSKGKIPKGKKAQNYSSDTDSNVALAINDDTLLEILSTRRACTRHSQCKGVGIGDDRSNGCWMGSCRMCLPYKDCYCTSSEGGGVNNWDVYVFPNNPSKRVWTRRMSKLPRGGGQYFARCNTCRERLEAGGIIITGSKCTLENTAGATYIDNERNTNIFNFFQSFGPPNSGPIGREGNSCHFNQYGRDCKLFCGSHNGARMHINYDAKSHTLEDAGFEYTEDKYRIWKRSEVKGLRSWCSMGAWNNGCVKCGKNLERVGFIQSGWICRRRHNYVRLHAEFLDGTD